MGATFGANVSKLTKTKNVWFSSAEYQDKTGTVTLTNEETGVLTSFLSNAGKAFKKVDSKSLSNLLEVQFDLPSTLIGASIKTYLNSLVRAGKSITSVKGHAKSYINFLSSIFQEKIIPRVKSDAAKEKKGQQRDIIIKNSGPKRFPNTFVRTNSGYKVVNDEGYVAIDKIKGNAVKLVDRLEFSYNNFNGIKNWDK